jgi:hypothetical protein
VKAVTVMHNYFDAVKLIADSADESSQDDLMIQPRRES